MKLFADAIPEIPAPIMTASKLSVAMDIDKTKKSLKNETAFDQIFYDSVMMIVSH